MYVLGYVAYVIMMSYSNHKSVLFPLGNLFNLNRGKFKHFSKLFVSSYVLQITYKAEVVATDVWYRTICSMSHFEKG